MRRSLLLLLVLALPVHATDGDPTPGQEFDPLLCPFQQPIAAEAVVDPAGAAAIDRNQGFEFLLALRQWTYPVYYVGTPGTYSLEDVWFTKNWHPGGRLYRNVPIPTGVDLLPDPTADGHICIVDTVRRVSWDFWACSLTNDKHWKRTRRRGRRLLTAKSGDKYYLDGSGASPIALSAKGSGFALVPGLIRPGELAAGDIPHALALAISWPAVGGPMPPATLNDEEDPRAYPGALPDGARLRLKPSIWDDNAIDATDWTHVEKTIARALRDYGAFVTDSSGDGRQVQVYAENATWYADPYAAIPGIGPGAGSEIEIFDTAFFDSTNFEVVDSHPQLPLADADDFDSDYDDDRISNAAEIAFGYLDRYRDDPTNAQENPDGDPLTNYAEWNVFRAWSYPANPHRADSDRDGVPDAGEIVDCTDPTDPFSVDVAPGFAAGAFAVPERGTAPLIVQWNAVVRGGTGPFTYEWDFGDASPPGAGAAPQHTYTAAGVHVARVVVKGADVAEVAAVASIAVGVAAPAPEVHRLQVNGRRRPRKLVVRGVFFEPGAEVRIDGIAVTRTRRTSDRKLVVKGAAELSALLPTGETVRVTVQNADGQISHAYPLAWD